MGLKNRRLSFFLPTSPIGSLVPEHRKIDRVLRFFAEFQSPIGSLVPELQNKEEFLRSMMAVSIPYRVIGSGTIKILEADGKHVEGFQSPIGSLVPERHQRRTQR